MTAMDDPTPEPDRPTDQICPWCSTQVTADTATCPTCGAVLKGDEDTILPGVTAVDDKVLRGETAKPQQRSRLLSWISGEYDEPESTKVEPGAIAPPDPEVQREIRRLELEAEVANLQAEVEARRIEAVVDHLDETGDEADAEEMVAAVVADDAAVDAEVAALTGDAIGTAAPAPPPAPLAADSEPEPSSTEQPPA
jgi:hypothetical protein